MTATATTNLPTDPIERLRVLRDRAAELRAQDAVDITAAAGAMTEDELLEVSRRRRDTRERLDTIEALIRGLEPAARALERSQAFAAARQHIKTYESSCAEVLVDGGAAHEIDAAIEVLAQKRRIVEAAVYSGDVCHTLSGLVPENAAGGVRATNRISDFDDWIRARLAVEGAIRDEVVTSGSGYREHSIAGWLKAWTSKHAGNMYDALFGVEHREKNAGRAAADAHEDR